MYVLDTTRAIAVTQLPLFSGQEVCDKCGVPARWCVLLPAGVLTFCGHHCTVYGFHPAG